MAQQPQEREEIELEGFGAHVRAKGHRLADFGWVLVFASVGLCYATVRDTGIQQAQAASQIMEQLKSNERSNISVATALTNFAVGQELSTCILSQPQERRWREYAEENSICARRSKLR